MKPNPFTRNPAKILISNFLWRIKRLIPVDMKLAVVVGKVVKAMLFRSSGI
jgi:hypothetical protein